MYEYTINELRRVSCIGQRATIKLYNNTAIKAWLEYISIDHIGIRDSKTGLEIAISNNDIERIIFEGHTIDQQINSVEISGFKCQCDRLAEESSITFGHIFRFEIERYANDCSNVELKNYLLSEIQNKAARYTSGEYEEFYEYLLSDKIHTTNDKSGFNIIKIMMLFRMRHYGNAIAVAVELMRQEETTIVTLIFVCLSAQMKNYMETIFWLECYYLHGNVPTVVWNNTWWFYLRMASKYATYETSIPLLKKMAEISPKTAVQGIAYLLMLNNNANYAIQVLDYVDEYLTINEAVELIESNSSVLVSDIDNNYHRFIRCIQSIIEKGEICAYDDTEDIMGYVYDYIPDREFGFILGFDLIVYFFRKESINSDNVIKHIKNNICSMSSVNEEALVMVTFRRSLESKRSYNAINIV